VIVKNAYSSSHHCLQECEECRPFHERARGVQRRVEWRRESAWGDARKRAPAESRRAEAALGGQNGECAHGPDEHGFGRQAQRIELRHRRQHTV